MSPETLSAIPPPRVRAPEVTFGPFDFDPNRRLLRKQGTEVPLPPRVLGVLELLLARAGDVVSRQEIIDTVWKEAFVTDTSLAEAVSFLRQALGDDPQSPTYIQTVHRRGYRFVSPVSELLPPQSASAPPPDVPAVETAKPSIANELLPWNLAILAVALAVSAVWYATKLEPGTPPVISIALDAGEGLRFDDRAPALAISPSGAKVAWSACSDAGCQLYLRPLDQLLGRPIPDTAGAAAPFFSPDERWLGFFADGKLKKVALAGGAPQIIADASQPFGAAWMPDGRIVFSASAAGGLMRVREEGGDPEALTMPSASSGEIRHAFPSSVRDGDALLFTVVTSPLPGAPGRLALLPYPAPGASWRTVAEGAEIGVAIGHEYVAFARGNEVHAVAFDRVRQAPAGVEQTVNTGILAPHIAASATGAFVSLASAPAGAPISLPPGWAWSEPRAKTLANGIEDLLGARLSPDGARIAAVGLDPRPDIWSVDLQRGTKTRLTYAGPTATPVWSANGEEVLYAARRSAAYEVWARKASAAGDERRVLAIDGRHVFPASVSRTGDLGFVETGGATRSDVGVLRAGQSSASLVVETPFDDVAPALSPDGSLLAYQTDESGRWEIILVRLRDGRRSPVSTGGGIGPFWAANGRTLFFERGDELVTVSVDAGGELGGGIKPIMRLNGARPAGVGPGGNILLHRTTPPGSSSAVLTLQWISELRAKLGPPTATSPR